MLSLQNLAKIGQLEEHATDQDQVAKLLDAATRFLKDARQETISEETRLNATDYLGELADEGSVLECIEAASRLQEHLMDWLAQNRSDLLE